VARFNTDPLARQPVCGRTRLHRTPGRPQASLEGPDPAPSGHGCEGESVARRSGVDDVWRGREGERA
jgi:hypothetical protein